MKQNQEILVCDLDGTLIKTDFLFETLMSAISKNFFFLFGIIIHLFKGRANLKRYLAEIYEINPEIIPYNKEVVEYIIKRRDKGAYVVLATASDQLIATKIANYLNLFDEVYASDGHTNLKGKEKANLLENKFGNNKFTYIGDSFDDVQVWQVSKLSVVFNASSRLKSKLENLGLKCYYLYSKQSLIKNLIGALRPHQWLKNILVLLPLILSHQLELATILDGIIAFFAFSVVASSVYILNDLIDLSPDRQHPRKKFRPFASGNLTIKLGLCLVPGFLVTGMLLSLLLNFYFSMILIFYFFITLTYSLVLKRLAIIDICTLAGLYTLRIIGGGICTNTNISLWLLGFSIFLFLALASVKRQAELVDLKKRDKKIIEGRAYEINDLAILQMFSISAGYISVLILALYISSPNFTLLYSNPKLFWLSCLIMLYWITRIMFLTHRGKMDDDPVMFAVKDRLSLVIISTIFFLGLFSI